MVISCEWFLKFTCYYCFNCFNCSVNKRCYLLNPRAHLLQYVCMPLQSSYTFKYTQSYYHAHVSCNSRELYSRNTLLEFRPGRYLAQCSANYPSLTLCKCPNGILNRGTNASVHTLSIPSSAVIKLSEATFLETLIALLNILHKRRQDVFSHPYVSP